MDCCARGRYCNADEGQYPPTGAIVTLGLTGPVAPAADAAGETFAEGSIR
jgi:hypothetical protein